jgi:hypothetical protein
VEQAKNQIELARELGQAGRPGPIDTETQGGGLPPFFSGTRVFDFHVWSENFREVNKRKRWVIGHSFSDYLKERDSWSGIQPKSHPFAPK